MISPEYCRPGNGAAFCVATMNYDCVAAIVAASQDRPARGPVDGLQSGQAIGGAALGDPRVAAPFSIIANSHREAKGCYAVPLLYG